MYQRFHVTRNSAKLTVQLSSVWPLRLEHLFYGYCWEGNKLQSFSLHLVIWPNNYNKYLIVLTIPNAKPIPNFPQIYRNLLQVLSDSSKKDEANISKYIPVFPNGLYKLLLGNTILLAKEANNLAARDLVQRL